MNNFRVLIAGTSSSYLEISKKILKFHYHDCEVDFAHSGNQCIEKASKLNYDIVLFDYQMGDRNGLEVIDSLRTPNKRMLLIPLIDEGEEGKNKIAKAVEDAKERFRKEKREKGK